MKVWLENKVALEREVDARKLAKEFLKWDSRDKDRQLYPLERRIGWFLSEKTIEGKHFSWDRDGQEELIETYLKLEERKR